ncbi:MAG: DUF2845 domain-containing protein [Deltaproteobacteria bacterium]|nr:DUF2845 domain-containing protein [Deltaproteobacteria bacterium]
MKITVFAVAISFTLAIMTAPSYADKRCGGDLISTGKLMYETEEKCGEPLSKERVGEVRYLVEKGKVERVIYITELVYKESGGYYVLTFEGSRLIKSEFLR